MVGISTSCAPERVLLLAHDALDVLQHAQAERQPGIDAGAGLADQAGAQHQPVRDDLRLAGFSFRVGRKYWLIRILVRSLLGARGGRGL